VGEVARLMADAGLIAIVALVSPFQSDRTRAAALLPEGRFLEVFVDTPIASSNWCCSARRGTSRVPSDFTRRVSCGLIHFGGRNSVPAEAGGPCPAYRWW
jgi:hypothetical protein